MPTIMTEDFNAAADTVIHGKVSTTGGKTLSVWGNLGAVDSDVSRTSVVTDGAGLVHRLTNTFGGVVNFNAESNKHASQGQLSNANGNVAASNNASVVVGFVDGNNFVQIKPWTAGGNDYECSYRVAGVTRRFSLVNGYLNLAGNPNNAALMRLEKEGAIVRAYVNGTLRATFDLVAEAAAHQQAAQATQPGLVIDPTPLVNSQRPGLIVVDATSRFTSWSADTLGVVVAVPANPTATMVDHDSILFGADAVAGAVSYALRYSKDDFATFTEITGIAPPANNGKPSLEVGGLTPATGYKGRWAATTAEGSSLFSVSSSAATTRDHQIIPPGGSLVISKTRAAGKKVRVVTANRANGETLGAINISAPSGANNTGAPVTAKLDVAVSNVSAAGGPTLSIGGVAKQVVQIDTITTGSGTWVLYSAGMTGTIAHYLLTHSATLDYIGVAHAETSHWTAGDLDTEVVCSVTWAGLTHNVTMRAPKGAVRWWDNKEAVAPSPTRLRAALTAAQTPYVNRLRTAKIPSAVPAAEMGPMKDTWRGAYNPASFGPNSAGTTPTSNNNYVGVTSAQGGDYISSRGWYHEADACYFDAAERNQDALITDTTYWNRYVQFTKYGMSHPNQGLWSATHHQFVDGQYPQSGHTSFETRTNTGAALFVPNAAGWGFDSAHLANQAWAHWVATEHPFAALALNQQLAFAVSDSLQWQRPSFGAGNYAINTEQDRAYGNALRAAWKMRHVVSKLTTANGRLIWSAAKIEKICLDFLKGVKLKNYDPAVAATGNTSQAAHRKILNLHFMRDAAEGMTYADGTVKAYMDAVSNFEPVQYLMEPLWIFTKADYVDAATLFAKFADYAKNKNFYLPGRALDWYTTARGSFMPIAAQGEATPYADWPGYKTWLETIVEPDANYTSFENHYNVHSYMRWRDALDFAKDVAAKIGAAPADFDPAIAKWETAAAGTPPSTNVLGIRQTTNPNPYV